MCPADIIALLIVLILVSIVYRGWKNGNNMEHMAPLDFGTYKDNYPRGECRTGKFLERKPCEVGNCPLGTTVSDEQYCYIQCAQDPDPQEREECVVKCLNYM